MKDGELVSGASSYSRYEGVIKVNSIGGSGKYTYNSELLFNGSVVESSNTEEIKFTPDSLDKTYTLIVTVTDSLKETITKTYTVNVEEKAINQTTIYYRGYDNPYIHYRIGDGEWTIVPGVKMEASSDIEGYGYKITIDLADAESLTACFNNGNGSWDSNNGNNYCFGVGTYTYSNGQINKIK